MRIAESGSHLEAYLEIRQALGLRIDTQRRLPGRFFWTSRGVRETNRFAPTGWAVEWACAGPSCTGHQ